MKEKILITLATGKTGYIATTELLKEGYDVRIFVRSRNARALELERLGAEIAIGDFSNYEQLQQALAGVSKVYYCYPIRKGMVADVHRFIRAAIEARIKTVVFMGQRIAEFADTGSLMTDNTREAYRLFEASGLNVVYFIPGYFADNVFVASEFILQLGMMASPFGEGRNPWISNGDMGRCVAALLKHPEPYIGKRLFPTGQKSISAKEIGKILSKVAMRKVRVMAAPDWLFLKAGKMLGKELGYDFFAIVQANIYNAQMRMHRFDIEPTGVVKELTGREPEDFEIIAHQYFDASPYRTHSFKNWLAAMKKFMRLPFTSLPNKPEIAALNS